jgi:acyl carrier protein
MNSVLLYITKARIDMTTTTTTTTETEVFEKMRTVLAESLGVDEELVVHEARLADDLGADSLDYLDISFRMEKAFGFPIKPNEMFLGDSPSEEFVQNGKITDAGLAELRRRMPHVDFERLDGDRDIKNFRGVFTVDTLVKFVLSRANGNRQSQNQANSSPA